MSYAITAPHARVYFNRSNDFPKVWSIDFGPGTAEILCGCVLIDGAIAETRFSTDTALQNGPDDRNTPRAWLELHDVRVEIDGLVARIYKAFS